MSPLDQLLDTGAEHLHDDIPSIHAGPVHLSERRGGERHDIEELEHRLRWRAVALDQARANLVGRDARNTVGERADGADVRLGDDVGAAREELRQLDERRPERGERPDHLLGAAGVERLGARRGSTEEQPSALVAAKAHEQREEPEQDLDHTHCTTYPARALPSRQESVRVQGGQRSTVPRSAGRSGTHLAREVSTLTARNHHPGCRVPVDWRAGRRSSAVVRCRPVSPP